MAKIDFHYIKTGTGELSGPSFVSQTELAVNELGEIFEQSEAEAAAAQAAAEAAQSVAQRAENTADSALARADSAQAAADAKAQKMHASSVAEFGLGTSAVYGHVRLSDDPEGIESADSGGTAATPAAVSAVRGIASAALDSAAAAQSTATEASSAAENARLAAVAFAETCQAQINVLSYFTPRSTPIDAESYAGSRVQLYLLAGAAESSNLPADISFPCFFWTDAASDGTSALMWVLSSGVLWTRTGSAAAGGEGEAAVWTFDSWQRTTFSVDAEFSSASKNPVQNKVITARFQTETKAREAALTAETKAREAAVANCLPLSGGTLTGEVKINDTPAAGWFVPDISRKQDLTLPATEGSVTAPGNGWICFGIKTSGTNGYIRLGTWTGGQFADSSFSSANNTQVDAAVPVVAGQEVYVYYKGVAASAQYFFFVPAKAEISE